MIELSATVHDDIDTRPVGACILHRAPDDGMSFTRADDGYRTCTACYRRLGEHLAEIRRRHGVLDVSKGTGDRSTRSAPGFGSRSPASDHVIAVTDPRTSRTARTWRGADRRLYCEDEQGPVSIAAELGALAVALAREWGWTGPRRGDVTYLCGWLDVALDQSTQDTTCVQMAAVLRLCLAQLRPLTGSPRPRYIGRCRMPVTITTDAELDAWHAQAPTVVAMAAWCSALLATGDVAWLAEVNLVLGALADPDREPAMLDELGDPAQPCGTRLYAPVGTPGHGDTIRCTGCGTRWDRDQWLDLGHRLQAAHLDAVRAA